MLDLVAFPILAVSQDTVLVHASAETFTVATKQAVRNGYFRDCWLLDSSGAAYVVTAYAVASEPFWKRPRTPFGRGIRLRDLTLKDCGRPSLDEVKQRLITCVQRDPEFWSEHKSPEFVQQLRTARSIEELFRLI